MPLVYGVHVLAVRGLRRQCHLCVAGVPEKKQRQHRRNIDSVLFLLKQPKCSSAVECMQRIRLHCGHVVCGEILCLQPCLLSCSPGGPSSLI